MASLISELQRRNVFRVGTAYVVMAWLLAQVAQLGLESFGAPDWVMKAILLLLGLGFPVAVILAWAFELTPDGVRKESEVDRSASITPQTGRRLNVLILVALAMAVAFYVGTRVGDGEPAPMVAEDPVESAADAQPTDETSNTIKSIAVLPFATFGSDPSDGYLADGLAEALLNRLAQIEALQVAARTSAFKFKGTNEDIRVIGQQLGVGSVLEGSVQRSGQKLRITAQLIDVANGFHLYSETFDREFTDLFEIQDEIAGAVVGALEVELLGQPATANPGIDAYEVLARIRSEMSNPSVEDLARMIGELQSLIAEHPDYAEAHATLSGLYLRPGAGAIPEDLYDQAIEAGRRAIAVAPDNPVGHIALAQALATRGRLQEAAPVVEKALDLQPGGADALVMKGALLAIDRRYRDALEVVARALRLDPLNVHTRESLSALQLAMGEADQAIETLDQGLSLEPDNMALQVQKVQRLRDSGRWAEAIRLTRSILAEDPNNVLMAQYMATFPLSAGEYEAARIALERAESLSLDRLADERANYCYLLNDEPCWHAATERLIATRNRWFVQAWHSRMLYEAGQIEDAIGVIEPVIDYFDQTNDWYGNHITRTNLAFLHDLSGDPARRDAAAQPVIDGFEAALSNGYGAADLYVDLAAVRAAQGDLDEAMRLLEVAADRGFRSLAELPYQLALDRLAERPDFQAFWNRIEGENAAMWEAAHGGSD